MSTTQLWMSSLPKDFSCFKEHFVTTTISAKLSTIPTVKQIHEVTEYVKPKAKQLT